jgi:hypothetical protein
MKLPASPVFSRQKRMFSVARAGSLLRVAAIAASDA